MLISCVAALHCTLCRIKCLLHRAFNGSRRNAFGCLLALCTPLVCFLMVELLSENNPFTALKAWQWVMNLTWYFCLLFLGWLITGRRNGAVALTALLSFLLGIANHYVLAFRGRALFPIDLLGWKTAANVAGSYSFSPDRYVWGGAAILCALLTALFFLPRQKKRAKCRVFKGIVSLGWAVYIFVFFFTSFLPNNDIYAQQWKTQGNGFLLNFTVSARYMRLEKPDGYSKDAAEELIETLRTDGMTGDDPADCTDAVTNFIIIMDESFADLTQYESLTLSDDPTPFYHSLTENTVKGNMISPVTGGGTAAVEFEVLTGNSMAFLPTGTVAYQLYVTERTPSLAQTADTLGYATSAYHPYLSSGWNRTTAYRYLGFASQYYEDQTIDGIELTPYSDADIVRKYVSDSADFARVYEMTEAAKEAGESCLIFNVTMQNHSGYTESWNNLSQTVTLTGDYAGQGYDNSTAQYLALARKTDEALEELITYYSSVEERTVILFFGDHQPPLNNSLFRAIYGVDSLDERTTEEVLQQYSVPFFIWANFDIEEQQDVTIGSSFLGVLGARYAGYPATGYMQFLSELNETFTAITPVGIMLQDGTVVSDRSELTQEQQELVTQYEYLQYYNLFAEDAEDGFFFAGE